jgi:hypothetical protein
LQLGLTHCVSRCSTHAQPGFGRHALGVDRHVGGRVSGPGTKQYCSGAVHVSWPQANVEAGAPASSPAEAVASVEVPASVAEAASATSTDPSTPEGGGGASNGEPPQPDAVSASAPTKRAHRHASMHALTCIPWTMRWEALADAEPDARDASRDARRTSACASRPSDDGNGQLGDRDLRVARGITLHVGTRPLRWAVRYRLRTCLDG